MNNVSDFGYEWKYVNLSKKWKETQRMNYVNHFQTINWNNC